LAAKEVDYGGDRFPDDSPNTRSGCERGVISLKEEEWDSKGDLICW
jgi:hypothetical protein